MGGYHLGLLDLPNIVLQNMNEWYTEYRLLVVICRLRLLMLHVHKSGYSNQHIYYRRDQMCLCLSVTFFFATVCFVLLTKLKLNANISQVSSQTHKKQYLSDSFLPLPGNSPIA